MDKPVQHLGRAVGTVANQALGIQIKALERALDHALYRQGFRLPDRRRGLDVDNDRVVHVDQIVGRIGEKRRPTMRRGPLRGGVCGDGGFMMSSQEMETAVRLKLNLVVLVLEDDAYGIIRWKQQADGFADWGLTFGNGAEGSRVTGADGLAPALEAAFNAGGVQLVVVPIDYSENMQVLSDELSKLTAGPGPKARD